MTKLLEEAVIRASSLPPNKQDAQALLMQAEMSAVASLSKVRPKPGGALDGLFQQLRREFKAGLDDPPSAEGQTKEK